VAFQILIFIIGSVSKIELYLILDFQFWWDILKKHAVAQVIFGLFIHIQHLIQQLILPKFRCIVNIENIFSF